MTRLASVLLAFALLGCAAESSFSEARRQELRGTLAENFVLTAVPKDKEDEFYRVLDAFAKERESNEFVSAVDFRSSDEALVSISVLGKEVGLAELTKKRGHWVITRKSHEE